MYVYIKSEPGLWTVGFFQPDGTWEPETDHGDREKAASRVAWLNGDTGKRWDPRVTGSGVAGKTCEGGVMVPT